jgi:hypothetical protein
MNIVHTCILNNLVYIQNDTVQTAPSLTPHLLLPHLMTLSMIPLDIRNILGHLPSRDSLFVQFVQFGRGSSCRLGTKENCANTEDQAESCEEPGGVVSTSLVVIQMMSNCLGGRTRN